MTHEKFNEYKKISDEIAGIKLFLQWCGDRYKDKTICKPFFNIIAKGKSFVLHKKYHLWSVEQNSYEIPHELQKRIVKVIEDYVDEREKELERL